MISHQSQPTQPIAMPNSDREALLQADRIAVLLTGYGEVEILKQCYQCRK